MLPWGSHTESSNAPAVCFLHWELRKGTPIAILYTVHVITYTLLSVCFISQFKKIFK